MFSTYSALIGESSQASGKYKTRLKQLIDWCGEDFDGCVSFQPAFPALPVYSIFNHSFIIIIVAYS